MGHYRKEEKRKINNNEIRGSKLREGQNRMLSEENINIKMELNENNSKMEEINKEENITIL